MIYRQTWVHRGEQAVACFPNGFAEFHCDYDYCSCGTILEHFHNQLERRGLTTVDLVITETEVGDS